MRERGRERETEKSKEQYPIPLTGRTEEKLGFPGLGSLEKEPQILRKRHTAWLMLGSL
jgi:hypothetical protein